MSSWVSYQLDMLETSYLGGLQEPSGSDASVTLMWRNVQSSTQTHTMNLKLVVSRKAKWLVFVFFFN